MQNFHRLAILTLMLSASGLCPAAAAPAGLHPEDLSRLRSVSEARIAPSGDRIVFTVVKRDRPGRPYSVGRVMNLPSGTTGPLAGGGPAFNPRWSPDGSHIAYLGTLQDRFGLVVCLADGQSCRYLAPVRGSNGPLPSTGESLSWSPDGRHIAFVSSTPGPEGDLSQADPQVISRYLYKPTASEGGTRLNDNRRRHIFVADLAATKVRQLTHGVYDEHSIDWSPRGDEILFVSNRGRDPDRYFNYDLFALRLKDGSIRRITRTESPEYRPRWSPDGSRIAYQGTLRGLTSSETTMENTHIWVINSDGSQRREVGKAVDNRQGAPLWAPDGRSILCTVQERGSVSLLRLPLDPGTPRHLLEEPGAVRSFSVSRNGKLAYAFHSPRDVGELFLREGSQTRQLTRLNDAILKTATPAPVRRVDFESFDGQEVEAFLTLPLSLQPGSRHPLIAILHGGPHGQQGPEFDFKSQVYAARGWAALKVNYRGSTGYGQRFTDLIYGDQDGGEARDVLYALRAALGRFGWIDPERLGVEGVSYGGQLTNWLVTQTNRFKAAIAISGISNLISFNYMAYYHDYLAVEFGAYPHQEGLMDLLWKRSPLRYVAQVHTPVLLVHGENDNDVPIAEAEQFFIALKDVGVETVMVRYPREGHGVREVGHTVDLLNRSIDWYQSHFQAAVSSSNSESRTVPGTGRRQPAP